MLRITKAQDNYEVFADQQTANTSTISSIRIHCLSQKEKTASCTLEQERGHRAHKVDQISFKLKYSTRISFSNKKDYLHM